MSGHPRISTPLSSSPIGTSAISRPGWPWAPRSYMHRSSLSSIGSSPGSAMHTTPWESARSNISSASNHGSFIGTPGRSNTTIRNSISSTLSAQNDGTRQWNFMGFEWVVRDISKLRDVLEGTDQPSDISSNEQLSSLDIGNFEILKQSPVLGDNKFKLEIAPTANAEEVSASSTQTLSLYLTSLMMEFSHVEYETSASIMAAIKCHDIHPGERSARPEWVWEHWQTDWVFRQESEVWECPLPPLSALLANPRIQETDSMVLCVQIHSPVSPSIPQHPYAYYVPCDLLEGLEASLDNANTGDIRFVCLEKKLSADANASSSASPIDAAPGRRSRSSDSSHSLFSSQTTARKRIIYAHSDILARRSEYFATMLSSSFSENPGFTNGERKLYTIVVEEADFETIYWLLKYCYANWLLFKENDDPRLAVEGVGAGWSARWLNVRDGEWDWKTFQKRPTSEDNSGDAGSSTSVESGSVGRSNSHNHGPTLVDPITTTSPMGSKNALPKPPANSVGLSRHSNSAPPRRPAHPSATAGSPAVIPTRSVVNPTVRSKPVPSPNFSASLATYPITPRSATTFVSTPDPHVHPTPSPPPASALSMYQVAHRYAMPSLAALALEHMMATITPQSSFALLLATSIWEELHSIVEDYVVDKWDEVSSSVEFEQCCEEVAAGEWGSDGGKTLMAVFRRLRSPNSTSL